MTEHFQPSEETQEERTLYVGPKISWEAQWEHAVRLFKNGCSVWIHDHSADGRCRSDGAHCRCGRLTQGPKGPILDLLLPDALEN